MPASRPAGAAAGAVPLPLNRALRAGLLGVLAALPVAAGIGALVDGWKGVWGGLFGLAVPVLFLGITAAVGVLTQRLPVSTMGAVVLGSWLVKLVVFIAVMAWLSSADFYSKPVFFAAFVVGVVGWLAVETTAAVRTRQPYVEPSDTGGHRL
jgi:hypothetical protein